MTRRDITIAPASAVATPRTPGDYAEAARAPATRRRYRSTWRSWASWAAAHRTPALPGSPAAVCQYLTDEAGRGIRPTTLSANLAAIAYAHRASGFPSPCEDPTVRAVLAGIRRVHGVAPRRKSPLLLEQLRVAVEACGDDLAGRRDAALLCVGWAAAMRRSELAALLVEDLAASEEGDTLTIRRSKTDQEGAGRDVGVPHAQQVETICPPCRLVEWLEAARIRSGPVFRRVYPGGGAGDDGLCGDAVATIVRERLAAVGLEGDWAGHSLRAGLVTESARQGVDFATIMATTGHRSVATLVGYIRDGDRFRKNAATQAGM